MQTPWWLRLYYEIEHGDEEHRKWLLEKLNDFVQRNPQIKEPILNGVVIKEEKDGPLG